MMQAQAAKNPKGGGKQLALPLPPESVKERRAGIADRLRGLEYRQAARTEKRRKRNERAKERRAWAYA